MTNKLKMIYTISYISLFTSYLLIFVMCFSFIIQYYAIFSEYEYIWFCSKILTVTNMIRKNNKYNVFYGYEGGQKVYVIRPKTYLNYLEFKFL